MAKAKKKPTVAELLDALADMTRLAAAARIVLFNEKKLDMWMEVRARAGIRDPLDAIDMARVLLRAGGRAIDG